MCAGLPISVEFLPANRSLLPLKIVELSDVVSLNRQNGSCLYDYGTAITVSVSKTTITDPPLKPDYN